MFNILMHQAYEITNYLFLIHNKPASQFIGLKISWSQGTYHLPFYL